MKPTIDTSKKESLFLPFSKQAEFIKAIFSNKYKYLLYGGAIRGGKSFVGIAALILLCKLFPGSRHIIVRRDLPTIKRNVIPVFNKLCPENFLLAFNRSDMSARFQNSSEILFMSESIQDDPELNRFRGLEFNCALLEEMNELTKDTFWKIAERSGSWFMKDSKCPSLILGTCNPSQGWVKNMFYTPWKEGILKEPYFYLPAKIYDNPHIPEAYLESLKSLPEEVYKIFVDGSWDAVDDANQLVPWEAIAICKQVIKTNDETMSLGADIGRTGPDPTVITIMKGPNIFSIERFPKTSITEAANLIEDRVRNFSIEASRVCVDSVGLGAGVVDVLQEKGLYVIPMIGGATHVKTANLYDLTLEELTQTTHYTFKNWKAYSFWITAEAIKSGKIGNIIDENLKADMSSVWYFVKNDKEIMVEKKEDLKKRLGRSPDFWDSFTYAYWAYISSKLIPCVLPFTSRQYLMEKAV